MAIPQIRDLVATGPLAHIPTLNHDGSPHVTVVWLGTEGDEFVMGHMGVWQKVRNIRAVFPPEPYRSRSGYITRVIPERFAGVGPWNPEQQ